MQKQAFIDQNDFFASGMRNLQFSQAQQQRTVESLFAQPKSSTKARLANEISPDHVLFCLKQMIRAFQDDKDVMMVAMRS